MGILYFQTPSWCDLLAFLWHPECPFLHHGREGIGGVCSALVYTCLEAPSAMLGALHPFCAVPDEPPGCFANRREARFWFPPQEGGQGQGCLLMLVVG